jgi:hydrogenase-4 membrane subunit HyfE
MDVLAIVGLLVCYVVQRRIRNWRVAVPTSVFVTLVAWVLVALALFQISPHPLLPAGLSGYALAIAVAVAIALFVAAIRYFIARRRGETPQ